VLIFLSQLTIAALAMMMTTPDQAGRRGGDREKTLRSKFVQQVA
jgi:hypothetical protein